GPPTRGPSYRDRNDASTADTSRARPVAPGAAHAAAAVVAAHRGRALHAVARVGPAAHDGLPTHTEPQRDGELRRDRDPRPRGVPRGAGRGAARHRAIRGGHDPG